MRQSANLIEQLFAQVAQLKHTACLQDSSAGLWWKQNLAQADHFDSDIDKLSYLAFCAPNFSVAFNCGYQFALKRMFAEECPELFVNGSLSCLCISEQGGNSPKAIECLASKTGVNGVKTFVTCASHIDHVLVMLDDQSASDKDTENNSETAVDQKNLKLLKISQLPLLLKEMPEALQIDLSAPSKFLPDVDKGVLKLNNFPLDKGQLLSKPAHEAYSKPFSVLEGLYIRLASTSMLLKLALVQSWDKTLQSDLIAQITLLTSIIENEANTAFGQVLLDTHVRHMDLLLPQVDELMDKSDAQTREHWQRDKVIFYMDFKLRPKRLQQAWAELNEQGSSE